MHLFVHVLGSGDTYQILESYVVYQPLPKLVLYSCTARQYWESLLINELLTRSIGAGYEHKYKCV